MSSKSQVYRIYPILAVLLFLAACSDRTSELQQYLPRLPEEFVRALAHDDIEALERHADEHGVIPFNRAISSFMVARRCSTLEEFREVERIINQPERTAVMTSAQRFGPSNTLDAYHARQDRPFEERFRLHQVLRAVVNAPRDSSSLELFDRSIAEFEQMNYPNGVAYALATRGEAYLQAGLNAEFRQASFETLEKFRECGDARMIAQVLGEIAVLYRGEGKVDSMRMCLDEALAIAREFRLPNQVPRIQNFYASFYSRLGRTALAHAMLRTSLDDCRDLKAGPYEPRYAIALADFYVDRGYWRIADRFVDRASLGLESILDDGTRGIMRLIVNTTRGRILMLKGEHERADRAFAQALEDAKTHGRAGNEFWVQQDWAESCLLAGRPARAIELADAALQVPGGLRDLTWLIRARACFAEGDTTACRKALDRSEAIAPTGEQARRASTVERDCLRVRLRLAAGDSATAWRALNTAVTRVESFIRHTDASTDGYLAADAYDSLRILLFDMVRHRPELGYAVTAYWQGLAQQLGTAPGAAAETTTIEARLASLSSTLSTRTAAAGAQHIVYAPVGDAVWRWHCRGGRITQTKLELPADSLRALAERAFAAASNSAPDSRDLRKLSAELLPADLDGNGTVLVTADRFLGQLPFEALDRGRGDAYEPLLARSNVAYLRYAPETERRTGDHAVVLLCRSPTGRGKGRYPYAPPLKAAPIEAEAVEASIAGARMLNSDATTKRDLSDAWSQAGLIYVVGHLLRDPEAPYLVMLPLAPPSDAARGEDAYLEIGDVRDMDLTGCDVAVLSGCSTGRPYLGGGTSAPSLADSFIDAGAACVVRTFWDVKDGEAAALMQSFIDERARGKDPVQALCDAKRQAMTANGGANSSHWASYGVTIANPAALPRAD